MILWGWEGDAAAAQEHSQGGGGPWGCGGWPEGSREGPDLVHRWVAAFEEDVFE